MDNAETNAQALAKPCIVAVEDDVIIRRLFSTMFQQGGKYQFVAFDSSEQAWTQLSQGLVPDICILDIMLPGRDGLTLLAKMRETPSLRRVKVIMCSALKTPSVIQQCMTLGALAYLTKPFTPKQILLEVEKALGSVGTAQPAGPGAAERASMADDRSARLKSWASDMSNLLDKAQKSLAANDRANLAEQLRVIFNLSVEMKSPDLLDAVSQARNNLHASPPEVLAATLINIANIAHKAIHDNSL